jgi:hypothetical protein
MKNHWVIRTRGSRTFSSFKNRICIPLETWSFQKSENTFCWHIYKQRAPWDCHYFPHLIMWSRRPNCFIPFCMTQIAFCRLLFQPFNYLMLDSLISYAGKCLICLFQFALAINKLHDYRKTQISSCKIHIGWITQSRVNNQPVESKRIVFHERSDPVTDYWPLATATLLVTEKRGKHHPIFES